MNKRIFILGANKFPRGSANANYTQYLALALKEQGWDVVVLGVGNEYNDFNISNYYKGIACCNTEENLLTRLGLEINFYKAMCKKYKISSDDYFILHAIGWLPQIWFAHRFGTNHMSYIQYEDIQANQYKFHLINPHYIAYLLKWSFRYKNVKKGLPISSYLENRILQRGAKTLLLPIMADTTDVLQVMPTHSTGKINFIYPGAKMTGFEDDFLLMLHAIDELDAKEKNAFTLHLTGTILEKIENIIIDKALLNRVLPYLEIHSWLEYSQLDALYKEMDFLLLVRYDNKITRANFPSKIPECMCYGIIPICTDVGDYTAYYLENGFNCFSFEANNLEACKSSIRKAISLNDIEYKKMRNNSRITAVQRFDYRNWSLKLDEFLFERS